MPKCREVSEVWTCSASPWPYIGNRVAIYELTKTVLHEAENVEGTWAYELKNCMESCRVVSFLAYSHEPFGKYALRHDETWWESPRPDA